MPINIDCPACGKRLKAPDQMFGKRGRCACGQTLVLSAPKQILAPTAAVSKQAVLKPSAVVQETRQFTHSVRSAVLTLMDSPTSTASVVGNLKQGELLLVNRRFKDAAGYTFYWLEITAASGLHGFTKSENAVESLRRSRFRVERVAFIVVASLVIGVGMAFSGESDLSPVVLPFFTAFLMLAFYGGANYFFGDGANTTFSEFVPVAEHVPDFDWRRFVGEPIVFVGALIGFVILAAIYVVVARLVN